MRIFSPAPMISTMVVLSLTLSVAHAAPAATNTVLKVTPTGTQPSGTVVTLTATVAQGAGQGGTAVPAGTVKFCQGTADLGKCNGRQLLGTTQLDTTGNAIWKLIPPLGSTDTYYAVFLPTAAYAGSASTAATVSVNGGQTTTTMLPPQGAAGNYTVSARVEGIGSRIAPTGNVNFQDSSNGFVSVATAALGVGATPAVSLEEPAVYSTYDTHTMAAAVADFNKDGLPDMALASNGSTTNSVTIYLGQPDGTMKQGTQQPISISSNTAYDISDIAVGDFKNSGNLDLAVTLVSSQQIVVVEGMGNGTFGTPGTGIDTGGQAQTLAVGDFDGDGKLDIAVGNQAVALGQGQSTPGNLVFMKGDGLLGFTAGAKNPAIVNPFHMVVADLNKDGLLDLAVAEQADPAVIDTHPNGKLTALTGTGTGTFTATTGWTQDAGPGVSGLVVDDFNNDGVPDVLVANGGSTTATLFLAVTQTPATFTSQSLTNLATQSVTTPTSADFDRDGNADVAVVDALANVVNVLLGTGTGTFAPLPQGSLPVGGTPTAVAAADFNGDGVADLLSVNSADNNASIVPVILSTSATASKGGVSIIGSNDHNIVASYAGNSLYFGSVSTNSNALTAQKVTTSLNLDPLQPDTAMQGENVTLTAKITPAQTQGFTPAGNVTFTANPGAHLLGNAPLANGIASVTVPVSLPEASYQVVANYPGDANFAAAPASNTQPLTIILPPPPTTTTLTFTNTGTTSLATLTAKVTDGLSGQPITAGTVDFCAVLASYCTGADLIGSAQLDSTGTAKLDTYLVGESTNWFRADFVGTVTKLPSNSLPEPAPQVDAARHPTSITLAPPGGSVGSWKLTATVTATGGTDPQGSVQFLDATNKGFVLGTAMLGAPTAPVFDLVTVPDVPVPLAGALPSSIAVGDLNSDHHLDLAVTNPSGGTVTLLKGAGNGNFTAFPTPTLTLAGAQHAVTADFNNDGMLDLMVAESAGNKKVMPYQGAGTGAFTPKTEQSTGNTPYALAVEDFNDDGLLDIAVVSNTDNNVAVLLNQDNFAFAPAAGSPYALGAGTNPQSVTAGDLDGDGIVDLAVANTAGKSLAILKGIRGGSFNAATTQTLSPAHNPQTITLGDFDGNGHLDLATANGDTTVSVFLGHGHLAFSQADVPVTNAGQTKAIVAGDFDGDGEQDLAVSDGTKDFLTVLLGKGDGTFPPAGQKNSAAGTTGGGFVAIGDFDENGQLDAIMANPATTGARLIRPIVTASAVAELDNVAVAGAITGGDNVTATYLGNARYLPSAPSSPVKVGTQPLSSTVSLYNVPRVASSHQPVTLTAQVVPSPSTQGYPIGGTVQFKNVTTGKNLGGPVAVIATGVASYTTAPGDLKGFTNNSLQAVYSGDTHFATGTGSGSIIVTGSFASDRENGTTQPQAAPSAQPRSGAGTPQPPRGQGTKLQKTNVQR